MNDLDILCSPSYWSKRLPPEEVIKRHIQLIHEASTAAIKKLPSELNIPYGATERQKLDIVGTDLPDDAPILVFLHGGYWQAPEISRASYHFIATNLHRNGIKTIFVGYDLCPGVTLPEIVQEVEEATRKCLQYARKSKGLYFMGHSAGAHLVAFLFTNFFKTCEENRFIVKGAILTSGVFDLSLLQKTVINESLKLDEEVAVEMSPLKQRIVGGGTTFHLIVGENESPDFIRQSEEFSQKLKHLGVSADFALIPEVDHFDIIERLLDEKYELNQFIVKLING